VEITNAPENIEFIVQSTIYGDHNGYNSFYNNIVDNGSIRIKDSKLYIYTRNPFNQVYMFTIDYTKTIN
jgi:hypothetical protein